MELSWQLKSKGKSMKGNRQESQIINCSTHYLIFEFHKYDMDFICSTIYSSAKDRTELRLEFSYKIQSLV